jgi:hypothetical protein
LTTEQLAAPAGARSRAGLRALRASLVLALGFLVPALLLYAPALASFATTIPGGPTAQRDGWQNVWNLWWTAFALGRGSSPLTTDYLYYPEGIGLFWQTLNVTNGLLALPITLTLGPVAAYNTLALASFVLAGLTMFWLARELGASPPAAFFAGALYSFAPLHVARLIDGQLEHMSVQWLPLYALLLTRALERGGRLAALGAGLLLLWITLTSLYQGLACLMLLGVYALVLLARGRSREVLRRVVPGALTVAAVWALPLLPALLGASGAGSSHDDDWLDSQRLHAATPLDFVLPNPNHPLWGESVSRLGQALHPDAGSWNVALGLGLLVLAALGLIGSREARREPWPWVALGAAVLALGPELMLGGQSTGIPLPYALLNLFPPVRLGQRPNYLALVALLALAVVAARGVDYLLARFSGRRTALLAGLGLLLAFELAPRPLSLTDPSVPEVFAQLAGGEPGAVLELPFLPESSEPLKAQLVHGRPIMGGFVSRTPSYPFPHERPALRALWTRREPAELAGPLWYWAAGDSLDFYGIRYIVVRWPALEPSERAALSSRLSAIPQGVLQQIYDFQGLSVYERTAYRDPRPFLYQRGLYEAERDRARAWQWMGEQAELVLVNPSDEPRAVVLELRAEALRAERDLRLSLAGPGGREVALAALGIQPWPSERRLRMVLPPGETTLRLRAEAEPADANDPRALSVVFTQLEVRWADE